MNQILDAFDIEYTAHISQAYQLKSKTLNRFMEYEKRSEFEAERRHSLTSELQKEVDKCRNLNAKNNDLSVEMASLTELNQTLSRQNDDMKNELNELNKKYQMLVEEKASFRKNFEDRLKTFINDMTLSHAYSSDQDSLVIDDLEELVQVNNNKRPLMSDSSMSSSEDDKSAAKRPKKIDPNSTDANDVSINDCVQQDVSDESDSDDEITLTIDESIEGIATDDEIACTVNDGN